MDDASAATRIQAGARGRRLRTAAKQLVRTRRLEQALRAGVQQEWRQNGKNRQYQVDGLSEMLNHALEQQWRAGSEAAAQTAHKAEAARNNGAAVAEETRHRSTATPRPPGGIDVALPPGRLPDSFPRGFPPLQLSPHSTLSRRQLYSDDWLWSAVLCCGPRQKGPSTAGQSAFDVPLLRGLLQEYFIPDRYQAFIPNARRNASPAKPLSRAWNRT